MKYGCYLKVCIVYIEREMSQNVESQEIRWCIQEDFEDIILIAGRISSSALEVGLS